MDTNLVTNTEEKHEDGWRDYNSMQLIEFKSCEANKELEEQLKYEELQELTKLLSDMEIIKELGITLAGIIEEQKGVTQEIEENIVSTNETLDAGNIQLVEVKENKVSYLNTRAIGVMVCSFAVGGPIGALVGIKMGIIAGGSSLAGGLLANYLFG